MDIDELERLLRLSGDGRRWIPGVCFELTFSKKDRRKRYSVDRRMRDLQNAARSGSDPSRLQHAAAALVECLLTPTHEISKWPESGRASEVGGERYEVAWVVGDRYGDPARPWVEPRLALLRNDAVIRMANEPVRPPCRYLGRWRGRYASGSTWARWDLHPATTDELRAFANEAPAAIRGLFVDLDANVGGYNLNALAIKGMNPWWMFGQMVAHPFGDFLEERFGFDAVIRIAADLSQEPESWKWSSWYLEFAANQPFRESWQGDLSARYLTVDAYREIYRRLGGRPA
jgi:hypothetical protein